MKVECIQLCQGPDVIAELADDREGERRWTVNEDEVVDDPAEEAQLYHCLDGDFTGYMVFRGVEYEDVTVCVVF